MADRHGERVYIYWDLREGKNPARLTGGEIRKGDRKEGEGGVKTISFQEQNILQFIFFKCLFA